ncbi:MAG: hypothetical protein JW804_00080 [Sedimentisphaerales bacterium]|nr:hypothetical protein [Sedimentisphaerales bacterium]
MTKIFLGGSRTIGRLNSIVQERIDNLIKNSFEVLIGDANGADKAMQKYLSEKQYRNVTVFYIGEECRNNIGNWGTHKVETDRRKKDFAYYTLKDVAMCDRADYGFMLWDGKSKGALNNILNLLTRQKKVVVYVSPNKTFIDLKSQSDLDIFSKLCPSKKIEEIICEIKQKLDLNQKQLTFA